MGDFNDDERVILSELAQNILAARRLLKWIGWMSAISAASFGAVYHLILLLRGVHSGSSAMNGD